MTAKESSVIKSFERVGKDLSIKFHSGKEYLFKDVPDKIVSEFEKAESKGRYFGKEIRSKFTFEKK